MPFNYQGGLIRSTSGSTFNPPIEITTIGNATNSIPLDSKGFIYSLSGAGGGGGAGGLLIGGGGGGAAEFVSGRILVAELCELMGVSAALLAIESSLGIGGSPGVGLTNLNYGNSGDRGGESILKIKTSGFVPSEIIIAIAKGGYGGLGGTNFRGYGFGDRGTTYTEAGGMGELVQRNEYRSRDGPDRRTTNLNRFGDGGDGGAKLQTGISGKAGYFSIEFF